MVKAPSLWLCFQSELCSHPFAGDLPGCVPFIPLSFPQNSSSLCSHQSDITAVNCQGGPAIWEHCRWPREGRQVGDPGSGAVKTYCISTHVMMRTARATMETTTKAVMACFFWLAATTARRSACSQRAPTYPEWQLRKTGTSAPSPDRGLIRPTSQEDWTGETQALQKSPKGPLQTWLLEAKVSVKSLRLPRIGFSCLENEITHQLIICGGKVLLKHFVIMVTMPDPGGVRKAANVSRTWSSFWQFIKTQVIFKLNVCIQNSQ